MRMRIPFISSRTIGIDLGTVNTVVVYKGQVVVNEPTLIVYDGDKKFFGREALEMVGYQVEGLRVVWPMVGGQIVDPDAIRDYMEFVLGKVCRTFMGYDIKGTALLVTAIPCKLETYYKIQVVIALRKFCNNVKLVEQPAAAVFGENIDFKTHPCVLVFDIGGGTVDLTAILERGTILDASRSKSTAGNDFDAAIKAWVLKKYDVTISDLFAQQLKHQIGCVTAPEKEVFLSFQGHNSKGVQKRIRIVASQMPGILNANMKEIIDFGRDWLGQMARSTPEALIRMKDGVSHEGELIPEQPNFILLTGGGGLLVGIAERLTQAYGIPLRLAKDPLIATALGAGVMGENPEILNRFQISESTWGDIKDVNPGEQRVTLPNTAPKGTRAVPRLVEKTAEREAS